MTRSLLRLQVGYAGWVVTGSDFGWGQMDGGCLVLRCCSMLERLSLDFGVGREPVPMWRDLVTLIPHFEDYVKTSNFAKRQ